MIHHSPPSHRYRPRHPYRRRGLGLWQHPCAVQQAPRQWRQWLADSGSLTAKLNRLSRGQLKVDIHRQFWGRARLSEARTMNLPTERLCLIREVVLRGPNGQPWVFARSVFPVNSLTGRLHHLRTLGTRPLGGFLFSHPHLGRSSMQVAELTPGSFVPDSLQGTMNLWGRRSVFTLYGKRILVSEIFLPALERVST